MEEGPNVDLIPKSVYNWKEISDDSYAAVVSGQALEHIEFFWITMKEIVRVTQKNGLICIIAPNGFGEHRYPVDCWRFLTDGMVSLAKFYNLEILNAHTNAAPNKDSKDWYSEKEADCMLIARKPYAGNARIVELDTYRCTPEDHKKLSGNMVSYEEAKKGTVTSINNEESNIYLKVNENDTKKGFLRDTARKLKAKIKHLFQG